MALSQGFGILADYIFGKDRIFAYMNLERSDLDIYERLHAVLAERLPRPDLVIYLQASDEVLWQRIKRRDRASEHALTPEYVSELNRAYNYYFFHYADTPLLVVNASTLDLATSDEAFAELLRQVDDLGGGTRYYVPAGTSGR